MRAVDKFDYISRNGRFAKKHDGPLLHLESGNMPAWGADNPRAFWQAADDHERANGALYHELEFSLPRELNSNDRLSAAREFVNSVAGTVFPYSFAIHGNQGNPHVHLMVSGRKQDGIPRGATQFFKRFNPMNPESGGCAKASQDERGQEWITTIRQGWQAIANEKLEAAGEAARIDCRSNVARGIEDAPGVHVGRKALRLERQGIPTQQGMKNRARLALNFQLRGLQKDLKKLLETGRGEENKKRYSPLPRVIGKPDVLEQICATTIGQGRLGIGTRAASRAEMPKTNIQQKLATQGLMDALLGKATVRKLTGEQREKVLDRIRGFQEEKAGFEVPNSRRRRPR